MRCLLKGTEVKLCKKITHEIMGMKEDTAAIEKVKELAVEKSPIVFRSIGEGAEATIIDNRFNPCEGGYFEYQVYYCLDRTGDNRLDGCIWCKESVFEVVAFPVGGAMAYLNPDAQHSHCGHMLTKDGALVS